MRVCSHQPTMWLVIIGIIVAGVADSALGQNVSTLPDQLVRDETKVSRGHREDPVKAPTVRPRSLSGRLTSPTQIWSRGTFQSIQVNVDSLGRNVMGDAANEPSIAVDPNNPSRMAIGWRQFDTVLDNFRQSGVAYSNDGGQNWHSPSPNVLRPNEFSSDPVLGSDAEGRFYYYALQPNRGPGIWACYMYRSLDGGISWPQEVYAWGGDKAWMAIDKTSGVGRGNIYLKWNLSFSCCSGSFTRSTDHGFSFLSPVNVPNNPRSGTLTVDRNGHLYIVGNIGGSFSVVRSSNAQFANQTPTFDQSVTVDLGGNQVFAVPPNPVGLLGQVWIASNHSNGAGAGNLYVLCSVDPPGLDPLDVMFVRSTDGGLSWSIPMRINDDSTTNSAWQWFGTMAVAPNGRIDAIWNDTRGDPTLTFSELYYSSSLDGGLSWSVNTPISPPFNHTLGYPDQNKLGDYYDMVSDTSGVNIAYAATFNGEQDVYYLRIGDFDCNNNGFPDEDDIAQFRSADCNLNGVPDECDADCNDNDRVDECETQAGLTPDCDHNFIPDECQPDFDLDTVPDVCDNDIDNDGVLNDSDICDFTLMDMVVTLDGRPKGDMTADCVVGLDDHLRASRNNCYAGGPGVFHNPFCQNVMDFDLDTDVDLKDWAGFQRAFGRQ